MFARVICRLFGHRINRRRVRHDGLQYRTRCQRCRMELVRLPKRWEGVQLVRTRTRRRRDED